MLDANSQNKYSHVRKDVVYEIDFGIEVTKQLAQLTKKIMLLTTLTTTSKEKCGLCSTLGQDFNTCPYQGEVVPGPE